MYKKAILPIYIKRQFSRLMSVAIYMLLAFSVLLLATLPIGSGYQLLWILLVTPVVWYLLRREVWLSAPDAIIALELTAAGELYVQLTNGQRLLAQVLPETRVSPWLTVLHLNVQGERFRRYVILLPDNIETTAFRRLRVWLNWGVRFK